MTAARRVTPVRSSRISLAMLAVFAVVASIVGIAGPASAATSFSGQLLFAEAPWLPADGVNVEVYDDTDTLAGSTTTDGNGDFAFTNLAGSGLTVYFDNKAVLGGGYLDFTFGPYNYSGAVQAPSGTVTGSVTDAAGDPVPGVSVQLVDPEGDSGPPTTPDSFGDFSVPGVYDGPMEFRTEAPGYTTVTTAFTAASGATVPTIVLSPSGTVTGSIANWDAALIGSTITLYEWDGSGYYTDVADFTLSGPSFSFPAPTAGSSYALYFDTFASEFYPTWSDGGFLSPLAEGDPGTVAGSAGATLNFGAFTVISMVTVSGTVRSGGVPLDNVIVLFVPLGSAPPSGDVTDVNGEYSAPLPVGIPYYIVVQEPGYVVQFFDGAPCPCNAIEVTGAGAPGSDMPGYDFDLTPLATSINILGWIYLPGCGCGPQDATTAHLYLRDGDYWTPVDAANDFTSGLVSFVQSNPGDYRVRFTDSSGNWLPIGAVNDNQASQPAYGVATTPDGCAVELTSLVLGDQPDLEFDLLAGSPACGDEPQPPAPDPDSTDTSGDTSGTGTTTTTTPRRATTTTATEAAPTATPTPTPTPAPTVTTQATPTETDAPAEPAKAATADLAWLWWLLGALLLLLLIAGAVILFRRRN